MVALALAFADSPPPADLTDRGLVVVPSPPEAPPRRVWALVVGVSEYAFQKKGIPPLTYADDDARAVAEVLRSPAFAGGLPPEQLMVLTDQDATWLAMRQGLQEFLAKAGRDDLVVVYFAGHGVPDPTRPADVYLLLHDSDPEHLPTTAITMDEVKRAFDRIPAERVVLFADACHSAGIALPGTSTRAVEDNTVGRFLTEMARTRPNRVVVTSSDADEVSFEGPQWGHGIFTWALLQAFSGVNDDGDGVVRLGEAIDLVRDVVEEQTGFRQHPVVSGEFDARLPLLVLDPAAVPAKTPYRAVLASGGKVGSVFQEEPTLADVLGALSEKLRIGFVPLAANGVDPGEAAAVEEHLQRLLSTTGKVEVVTLKGSLEEKDRARTLAAAKKADVDYVVGGIYSALGQKRSLYLSRAIPWSTSEDEVADGEIYHVTDGVEALVDDADDVMMDLLTASVDETVAQEAIKQTIIRGAGQLKYCYESRLKHNPDLEGRVEIAWTILPDGTTTNVKVLSDTSGDPVFSECIQAKTARWTFPAGVVGDVEWPFIFKQKATADGGRRTSTDAGGAPSR